MDGHRFDRLARALATGSSRRQVLKGLLGLGGAAAVGGAILSDSDARTIGSRPSLPPPPTPKPPPTPTATPTPTPPPLCQGYRCGLDCCDEEIQCCDGECCPDGASCLTRLFPEDPSVQEETCCRNDQICDTSTVKCCADGQQCCRRDGQAFCIPIESCCVDDDCPKINCQRGSCAEDGTCVYKFDCTLGADCCESSDSCSPASCNPETGSCDQTTIACGCVSDGNGETVSCGQCPSETPCCSNGACGPCPACVCPHGPTVVTLADGRTLGSNGGAVCISPCSSDADCTCGQLCAATYQLCLPGTPTVDCTSNGFPAGSYCAFINICAV